MMLQKSAAAAPTAVLTGRDGQGKALEVTLALPDAVTGRYRGTRFAQFPMITTARWNGHDFWGEWLPSRGDPTSHDANALGTAEEFDINGPESYAAAAPGEPFLKIGVGLLKKPEKADAAYSFTTPYEVVRPARPVVVGRGGDFVETEQEVRSDDGRLGYRLRYRVALVRGQSAVRLTRTLTNLGSQPLRTEHYGHNFLRIDGDPAGPAYRLDLSFAPVAEEKFAAGAKASGLRIEGNTLSIADPVPPGKAVYAPLLPARPGKKVASDFILRNMRTGAALRATHKGPDAVRFAFYAAEGSLCPEPFLDIRLAPGKKQTWETTYTLTAP